MYTLEKSLREICLYHMSILIKSSLPQDLDECESIVEYASQVPKKIIPDLEKIFFDNYFELTDDLTEMQYLTWYNMFLQPGCSRFWLNKKYFGIYFTWEFYSYPIIPIIHAVLFCQEKVVKLLLGTLTDLSENKLDINARCLENNNANALHIACEFGYENIVELLLETLHNENPKCRVEINARNANMETPLHLAGRFGNRIIIKLFLKTLSHKDESCRVDLNAVNSRNDTVINTLDRYRPVGYKERICELLRHLQNK